MGWKTKTMKGLTIAGIVGAAGSAFVFAPFLAIPFAGTLALGTAGAVGLTAYGPLKLTKQVLGGAKNVAGGVLGQVKEDGKKKLAEKLAGSEIAKSLTQAQEMVKNVPDTSTIGKLAGKKISNWLGLSPQKPPVAKINLSTSQTPVSEIVEAEIVDQSSAEKKTATKEKTVSRLQKMFSNAELRSLNKLIKNGTISQDFIREALGQGKKQENVTPASIEKRKDAENENAHPSNAI